MTIETASKVNLTLEVLGRRPDGYHELATVFQAIDLCDRLRLEPADDLRVTVKGAAVPADQRNLCYQAAQRLARELGRAATVHITLEKHVPVGGGLGGGSANAAGVLAALNEVWRGGLEAVELEELAAELGSDCAFFIRGGTVAATGRGEHLTRLPVPTQMSLLVIGPSKPVPTAAVYRALQGFRDGAGAATDALAAGLRAGVVPPASQWLLNDLGAPAERVSPVLREESQVLGQCAAGRYLLSGSGGSWFVVCDSEEEAMVTQRALRERWPGRLIAQVRPIDWGWRWLGRQD